jgi:uncharacterized protein (DUF1501 family)
MTHTILHMPSRRAALSLLGAAGLSAALAPHQIAFAKTGSSRKLIFILQRGAADGLSTLIPMGDPSYSGIRGGFQELESQATKLDAMFSLHPALGTLASGYAAKEALFVQAIASAYRERSHFDAQNVVETGGLAPYAQKDGWMNRMLGMVGTKSGAAPKALAYAPAIPAALRGSAPVASYAPSALPDASDDLIARVGQLYAKDDALHNALETAVSTRAMAGNGMGGGGAGGGRTAGTATGQAVAKLMAGPSGADIVMIETGGWDTHNGQMRRLNQSLSGVDAMVAAIKAGMGTQWADTAVLIATEFGRTVAVNGTGGTDHGTASAAMLMGGAVNGGRVIADWPGLAQANLYEGRDLKPTASLESLITGLVAGHFALDPALVSRTLYPTHSGLNAMEGLMRG